MDNPTVDSGTSFAKPAAFVAEFIRSHKAMDETMQRVWERALADSIARPKVVRFKFAAPAPRAAQPGPAPRRQRKPSITTILKQARKAGAERVTLPDGMVLHFNSEPAPATGVDEVETWFKRHAH